MNLKLRLQAIGISMLLFGSPIIHFFRDYVGVLPKSPYLMPIASIFWLIIIFDINRFKNIFKPNTVLLKVSCWFFFIALAWALFNFETFNWFKEGNNYIFLLLYLFVLCTVPKEIYKYIFQAIIIITIFDNLALIYSFVKNPLQQIGQRAIISADGWGEGTGNPTLYSFMAFAGIIATYICFNKLGIIWKFIQAGNILTGFAVIFLTMTRATFIAFGIIIILSFIFNLFKIKKYSKLKLTERRFSKTNFALIFIAIVIGPLFILNFNPKLVKAINVYTSQSMKALGAAITTISEGKKEGKKAKYADDSAKGRVENLALVGMYFNENPQKFIIGFGYKFFYVDIPIVQVLIDLGILGLFFYLLFQYKLFQNIRQIYYESNNPWLKFWWLYYCLLLVNMVSRGQPYEAYFWMYYVTMIRFFTKENLTINESQ